MERLYIILLFIVVYCLLSVAMNQKNSKEKLEGKWNIRIADAPYGYQDYLLDITLENDEYKAEILYMDSKNKISDRAFTMENGRLTGNINMENEKRIDVIIWEEKGVVKGIAKGQSIGGTLPMKFNRPKD